MSEDVYEVVVVDMPVKPGETTLITGQVRHGRPDGATASAWYGLIEIPGLDHPVILGPHDTAELADIALSERLQLMSEQISAQGFANDVVELSTAGRN